MKRKPLALFITLFSLIMLGIVLSSSQTVSAAIANDQSAPTGDPSVGYPQIAIRTNRTAERTDMNNVIKQADDVANQFPIEDQSSRAKAVTEKLTQIFGSGSFGHAWIIIFNSEKEGDYVSYGYHEGFGFVKNGTASNTNDRPDRKFHLQKVLPITEPGLIERLESTVIPNLNEQSLVVAKAMGMTVEHPENGAYTPINNCSWFAGNLWNSATNDTLVFEQDFDGSAHAKPWGMPFLSLIRRVGDPGMIAESINQA